MIQLHQTGWAPPRELDEYRLLELLGQGSSGAVWLAEDQSLGREVAVKLLIAARPTPREEERFLLEARTIARLRHPNVVVIHRVAGTRGRRYLVYELLRGRSLDRLPRPAPADQVQHIALGLARGLAAAHRLGILHRDLKLSNAFLTEEGEVKLIDFGLAKLLSDKAPAPGGTDGERPPRPLTVTHSSDLLGTPNYMAPELWQGAPATQQSDVYALGVTLFQLLTGTAPLRAESQEELEQLVREREAPPLRSLQPEVPAALAEVVDRCLRRAPEERFASGEAVREALEALHGARDRALLPEGNPYRGLLRFEPRHRGVFFGRDAEIGAVIERLRAGPFVVIAGRSGVGKSSLLHAGVLPLVESGALGAARGFDVARLVPGQAPLAALVVALAPLLGCPEEELAAEAQGDPGQLARRARSRPGDRGLLLAIDQLEELLTLARDDERVRFVQALAELLLPSPRICLVATLRSDFIGRFDGERLLREPLTRALYLLGPLGEEGLRDAVLRPAEMHGVRFESTGDVDELVRSALGTEGSLPLLEFVASLLWERRDRDRALIPRQAVERIGGLEGALAQHADEVLEGLPPSGQVEARRLLLRLASSLETRHRRTEPEILDGSPNPRRTRETLGALIAARLVVTGQHDGVATYELAHEALLTRWTRLRLWLSEDDGRLQHERLALAARDWERLGRADEQLWTGRRLADLDAAARLGLSALQRAFAEASRRRARALRLRRWGLLVGLPLLLGCGIGGWRLVDRWSATRRAAREVARAGSLLDLARQKDREVLASRARAFRLYDQGEAARGDEAWAQALASRDEAERRYLAVQGPLFDAFSRRSDFAPARRLGADLFADRLRIAERDHADHSLVLLYEQQLALYDGDGRHGELRHGTGTLAVRSAPPGAAVTLYRFVDLDGDGVLEQEALGPIGVTPLAERPLGPGSFLLELTHTGRERTRLPVRIDRGQSRAVEVRLPAREAIPHGYVHVPGGPTLYGSPDGEAYRRTLEAQPLHEISVPSFLIRRHEVTFGEWLEYLRALDAAGRAANLPRATNLELREDGAAFALVVNKTPLAEGGRYQGHGRSADWRRWPVVGVDWDQARAYARWLSESGREKGARLCREMEWERAARGADGRRFPMGERLPPQDANHWATYGRRDGVSFLDEVGAHPGGRSVFGADDMAGNVFEWTEDEAGKTAILHGGSWMQEAHYAQAAYRWIGRPGARVNIIGFRLCRPAPES